MNKKDLLSAIAEAANLTLAQADTALTAVFNTIQSELVGAGSVAIQGFGSFSIKARAARQGRNPSTGEAIAIAASTVPVFKASPQLKSAVNKMKDKNNA